MAIAAEFTAARHGGTALPLRRINGPIHHDRPRTAARVTGEVYDVAMDVLRDRLLPAEPPELELGVIELADGSSAFAMLLRRPCTSYVGLIDITEHGSWQGYRNASKEAA